MEITDVTVYLAKEARTFCFVVIDTDAGIYGVGEAGITGRELAVAGAVEHFKPLLIGENPFRIEHLWQVLFRAGFFPAQRILSAAIAAIDIALYDIKGKALGVPVYELLGGQVRDKIVTYNHIGGATPTALAERAKASVDEGWKFIRWGLRSDGDSFNPTASVNAAVDEFAAIRAAVGDDIELCFDAHTRIDHAHAARLCREVESYRPFFIEDPLRSENPDSYTTLRTRTAVPLAVGEQYSSKWDFRQMIEDELMDYARIDVCICGGLTESKKVAGWCETHYIDVAVHNPIGPVASVACMHLNLTLPNFAVQELPRKPTESLPDVISGAPQWDDGYLLPSDAPGLGIEFDRDKIANHPFEMVGLPQLRRVDAGFTNW
jgi:L-alanine-DL-glutamate epimerase-like enolase superfamily enzyme